MCSLLGVMLGQRLQEENRELVLLYWQIGQAIIERQKQEGWGAKVIERLADDLRREFPDIKGVAEYQPAKALPESLKGSLPSVEQLEAELMTVEMAEKRNDDLNRKKQME